MDIKLSNMSYTCLGAMHRTKILPNRIPQYNPHPRPTLREQGIPTNKNTGANDNV
jgi:hypothetical protein